MEWVAGFYRDDERGESIGNILGAVAALFPPTVGKRILTREPIQTRWRLLVRTLKNGAVGYFIWTEPQVLARLEIVFEDVFRGYPRDEKYPHTYNEGYQNGLPMVCLSLETHDPRLTVWLPRPDATSITALFGFLGQVPGLDVWCRWFRRRGRTRR